MRKKIVLLFAVILTGVKLFAQDYYMDAVNGQTITTCRGNVMPSWNCAAFGYVAYCNNETYQVTFYSGNPAIPLKISFLSLGLAGFPTNNTFYTESGFDKLTIINGPAAGSPTLATLSGAITAPFAYVGTSGYLTLRFTSDVSNVDWGWFAILGCQPQGCGGNAPAADNCSSATALCDLNGYCGSTNGWYTPDNATLGAAQGGPFCGASGSIENNAWIKFIPNSTSATINVNVQNCSSATQGLQAGLYSTPNCASFTQLTCQSQATYAPSMSLTYNSFVPGNIYYLMIDGYAGNACDYTVNATGGVAVSTINATSNTICVGQSSNLTAVAAGSSPTYNWSTGATSASISVSPTLTTVYTATVSSGFCTEVINKTITVNSIPTANPGSAKDLTCAQTTTVVNGSGGGTYSWTGPSGFSSSLQNPIVSNPGTYSLVVTVNGCNSPATTVAVSQNTTAPTATASTSGAVTCLTSTINLAATPSALNYTWTAPGGSSITGGANNQNTTGSGIGTYTVKVLDPANGCTNTAVVAVNVNTTAPTVSASSGSLNCNVTSTTVVVSTTTTPVGYNWTGPGITGGASTASATVNTSGTYNYTVTDSNNGCKTTGNVSVSQDVATPAVSASSGSLNCNVTSTTVVASTTTTPVSYNWTGPGITSGASSSAATVNASGTYNYTVTNTNNGCKTTGNVAVNQNTTTPTVSASSGSLNCNVTSTTVVASTTTTPVSYNWTGPGITSGASSSAATVNASGTYNYTVTNTSNGCKTTGNVSVAQDVTTPAVSASSGSLNCNVTSTTVVASTTTTPVSYNWTGPGVTGGATSSTATINSSGTYNYTVTNTSNGCKTTGNVSVSQDITTPAVSASSGSLNCNVTSTTVVASTTTTPVSYNWTGPGVTGGATASTATVNASGTYNYTITNTSNGCKTTGNVSVSQDITAPTVAASAGSLNCTATSTTVVASTTTSPSSYNWTGPGVTGGATAATATVNTSGTYNYTVTNTSNGCKTTGNVSVSQNTVSPSVSSSATGSLNCSVLTTQVIASTTTTPVSYNWTGPGVSSGATTASATVNTGGTYSCTVMNTINNCTAVTTVSVSQSTALPSVTATATSSLNCSVSSATAALTTTATPVTYAWTGPGITSGTTSSSITLNTGGAYSYTVDNSGCKSTGTVNIAQNTTPPSVTAAPSSSLNCQITSTTIVASTTASPVGYNWTGSGITGGSGTASVTVNAGGTYNYTVTNTNNNCSTSGTVAIIQNTVSPIVTSSSTGSLSCSVTTVQATASTTTTPVSYTWTGSGITAGATTASATVNAGGLYNYTVTNTNNNCSSVGSVSITQNIVTPSVTASASSSLNCITTSTTVIATTTTSPVSYNWTGPGITGGATSATATVNAGGTYNYTVTNASNNCSVSGTLGVIQDNVSPSVSVASTNSLNCTATTATISVSTTATPVTYTWSGSGITSGNGTSSIEVNQGGSYTYSVLNTSNGCVTTNNTSVPQNTTAPSTPVAGVTGSLTCTAGQVTLTSVYSPTNAIVNWVGAGICGSTSSATTTACASQTYTLIITDPSNNCSPTTPATVFVAPNPGAPASPTVSLSGIINCTNTALTMTATTASAVNYSWSPGSGISGSATNSVVTVTTGGIFTLTITDPGSSCSATITQSVTMDNTPVTPTISASSTITCANPTATLTANGGTGSYTYNWSGPGIVGSNTLATVNSNAAGIYTVIVTNTSNGCPGTETVSVTSDTVSPTGVSVSPSSVTLTCVSNNAQLIVNATGASTYSWTAPSSGSVVAVSSNTANIAGPGAYSVVATGSNGCSAATVTVDVVSDANTPVLTLSTSSVNITCVNITPTVSASSTITSLSYTWSPITGMISGMNGPLATFSDPGTYSVAVTNTVNGCSTMSVITIGSNTIAPTATVAGGSLMITCASSSIDINPNYTPASGLTYTWTGTGIVGAANNSSCTVNAAGIYTVDYIDSSNGCVGSNTLAVTGGTIAPTLSVTSSSSIGLGCSPNSSTISLTSSATPTSGLNYSWSNGASTPSISVNTPGIYTLSVTDPSNNCTTSATINVTDNRATPNSSAGANTSIPCGASSFTLNGSSSTAAATYTWAGAGIVSGINTPTAVINQPGTFTLTVTDSITGCISQSTVNISNTSVTAGFTSDVNSGVSPLTVNFTNTSVGAVNYNWNFGNGSVSSQTNTSSVFNGSGSFTVTLIASAGACTDTATTVIMVEDGLFIEIPNVFTPNGDGINDLFTITSKGVKELSLQIFNRWGQKMFEFYGVKAAWDGMADNGNEASAGTYFYLVKAKGYDDKEISKNGTMNLFR